MYSGMQNVRQTSIHYTQFRTSDFLNFAIILFLTLFPLGKDTFYHHDSTVELSNKECGAK